MKKLILCIIVVLTMSMLPITSFAGGDSIRTFVGGREFSPLQHSGDLDYFWYSISYAKEWKATKKCSLYNTIGMGLIGAREASAPQIEYRILGRYTYKQWYFQAGGGLSHAFNPNDIPHLAESPLYGILSGEIGYKFENGVSLAYAWEHLSSPFHDDSGLNVGAFVFQVDF